GNLFKQLETNSGIVGAPNIFLIQTRAKWSVQNPNLRVNQLVLLKNPNTKPLDWPMGCILEVFPVNDGPVK
ncbi:hypothetical protein TNCT_7721, partial [Trichonephila clavata]